MTFSGGTPSQKLNKTSSSELAGEASGAFRERDLPCAKTTPGSDFDSAFRELEEMELLGHSSNVRSGSCDRTNRFPPFDLHLQETKVQQVKPWMLVTIRPPPVNYTLRLLPLALSKEWVRNLFLSLLQTLQLAVVPC